MNIKKYMRVKQSKFTITTLQKNSKGEGRGLLGAPVLDPPLIN